MSEYSSSTSSLEAVPVPMRPLQPPIPAATESSSGAAAKTAWKLSMNPLASHPDILSALHTLLAPLDSHLSAGAARVKLGHTSGHFDDTAAELEGFARRLWGAVPAGIGLPEGEDGIDWDAYMDGIEHGIDPNDSEYWGEAVDKDQRLVEMAPIGFALATMPDKIWKPLIPETKMQLATWLLAANQRLTPNNNWHFFRVFVNLGLCRVGAQHSLTGLHAALDNFEEWYLGDGWYSDGATQQRDYYITFAIHFYSLVYVYIVTQPFFAGSRWSNPDRIERYKLRAALMAKDFVHWFDPDTGASIPFGRSLTYRFAIASFWGALALAGVEVEGMSLGVIKGIWLRNLRWWLWKKEIFNGDGTLGIGYAYNNLNMAEAYNSPGSPYWAMKAFIPLALKPDHPFWSPNTPELPIPPSHLPSPHPIPNSHMIIVHSSRPSPSAHTYALASGQYAGFVMRHSAEKYGKLAYSATFGFCVPTGAYGLEQAAPDCTLAISDDAESGNENGNGNHWRVRRVPLDAKIIREEGEGAKGTALYSRWDAWKDIDVQTWLVPVTGDLEGSKEGDWHIRIHRITTGREIWTSDGGFSVRAQSSVGSQRRLTGWAEEQDEGIEVQNTETDAAERVTTSAVIRSSVGTTGIVSVPWAPSGEIPTPSARVIHTAPNSSIMFSQSALPAITHHLTPREEPYWLLLGVFALSGKSKEDGWRDAWQAGAKLVVPEWLAGTLSK
ncbi:hypothetical protein FRB90_006501 [Tulasnella sp. 427]|nr:hypothetical protein FRB90_006501 [Tulasnella sp. 427]